MPDHTQLDDFDEPPFQGGVSEGSKHGASDLLKSLFGDSEFDDFIGEVSTLLDMMFFDDTSTTAGSLLLPFSHLW